MLLFFLFFLSLRGSAWMRISFMLKLLHILHSNLTHTHMHTQCFMITKSLELSFNLGRVRFYWPEAAGCFNLLVYNGVLTLGGVSEPFT